MNRREFCRMAIFASGTALIPPIIASCGAPLSTLTPTTASPTASSNPTPTLAAATAQPTTTTTATATAVPTAPSRMTKIALIKTSDRAEGVRRAIEMLGINPVRGNRVLLKPNFNSADPAPGSTHPDVLRALILKLNDLGARAITLADRSGMGDTRRVMQDKGVLTLANELGFDAVVLDELSANDWVIRQAKDFHWSHGFAVPRLLLDAECLVQTCNLKTHRFGGHFTLSLKNSVGFAAKTVQGQSYMNELHGSPYQRQMIAEINTAYTPALIVMDGVEAFVNGGPDQGVKVKPEVVLAGTDRIALDAVGVAILRMFGTTPEVSRGKIFEQEQIARAVELGLGITSPAQIEFVTTDAASLAFAQKIKTLF